MNDKPSTLLAAVGLGALSACTVSLALYGFGYMPQGWAGLGAFLGFFGAGFGLVPWWEWAHYKAPAPLPETPRATPTPAHYDTVSIGGAKAGTYHAYRPSTAIEGEWITATADFLLHARALGSLAGPAHVGVSVQNPNDWQLIIAPLVEHGAVMPTQKGVTTRFAPEWDSTRAYNAVMAGWVQFPETRPPKLTPYSAKRMTVDAAEPSIG